jgi:hypothetical protein
VRGWVSRSPSKEHYSRFIRMLCTPEGCNSDCFHMGSAAPWAVVLGMMYKNSPKKGMLV